MIGDRRPPCALTIAGSDSGGGAGIQADLKAFAAHGVHGLSAIAALTAQHTRGVTAVHVPDAGFLRAQIDTCFADFRITAVKLGMLASAEVSHAVADALEAHAPAAVVLDPVMVLVAGLQAQQDLHGLLDRGLLDRDPLQPARECPILFDVRLETRRRATTSTFSTRVPPRDLSRRHARAGERTCLRGPYDVNECSCPTPDGTR